MSEDLDISTFTVHKIIIIKNTCLWVNVVCADEYQGRRVACDIFLFDVVLTLKSPYRAQGDVG